MTFDDIPDLLIRLNAVPLPAMPNGVEFLPWNFYPGSTFEDTETGEEQNIGASFFARFIAFNVFPGEEKNSAQSSVAMSIRDIDEHLEERAKIQLEVAMMSLLDLLKERGVAVA